MSNATESAILNLVFKAIAWAGYADNAAASPETNIVIGLHTADPGEAGTMATSEAAYTGYLRQNVTRGAGFTVTGGSCSPAANIDFPAGTGGSGTATFGSTGKSGGGAAPILFSGSITPPITMGNGVTPRLTPASAFTLD
jgi:hypothetical protein